MHNNSALLVGIQFFLLLVLIPIQSNSQAQCATSYDAFCNGCYNSHDGTVCSISGSGPFVLGGIDTDGNISSTITIWDVGQSNNANNFQQISSLNNVWNNLPLEHQMAFDALIIAEEGSKYFKSLGLPDFIPHDIEIYVDAIWDPSFGNGAVASENRIKLTTFDPDCFISDDVLAHEFAHIYLWAHTPDYQRNVSNEMASIYESFADVIGINVEGYIMDRNLDWVIIENCLANERNFQNPPSTFYDSPAFEDLPVYEMLGVGSHWYWLVANQTTCFINDDEMLKFIIQCLDESSEPKVIDYPTYRISTLEHYYNLSNVQDCNSCYIDMVNKWNEVGVGDGYVPQQPIFVSEDTGPCSIALEWEDQGVPKYWCEIFEVVNNIPQQTALLDQCVEFQTFVQFCTSSLNAGEYEISIRPACNSTCDPLQNIPALTRRFIMPGRAIDFNSVEVTASNCDIVVSINDIGLDDNDYSFYLVDAQGNENQFTNVDFIRQEGLFAFYLFDFLSYPDNGIQVNDILRIEITERCDPNNTITHQEDFNIIQDDESIYEYHIDVDNNSLPRGRSLCKVQPELLHSSGALMGTEIEFTNANRLVGRINRITEAQFNQFQARTDKSYALLANNNLLDGGNEFVSRGPVVPVIDLPFDYNLPLNQAQYFIINMESQHRPTNPAHPRHPHQNCVILYNTDCIAFELLPPTCSGNPQLPVNGIDYCINDQSVFVDFTLPQGITMMDISHIEYRYHFENEPWSECHIALTENVIIQDPILLNGTRNCVGNIEIQARIICGDCAQADCDPNWGTQAFSDDICSPVEYTGAEHCGTTVSVGFNAVPGAYGYQGFLEVIDPADVNTQPRIICLEQPDCFITQPPPPVDPDLLNGATLYVNHLCPQIEKTMWMLDQEVNLAYRAYVQTLCCDGSTITPTCDQPSGNLTGLRGSECLLVVDVPASCGFDPNQEPVVTALNSTQLSVSWDDPDPNTVTYIVTAIPECNPALEFRETRSFDPGEDRQLILTGLIPSTNYTVTVSKNCSGTLCFGYTSDISTNESTPDIEGSYAIPICPENGGAIVIELDDSVNEGPTIYQFELTTSGFGYPAWDPLTSTLTFSGIQVPGTYTFLVDRCPGLSWSVVVPEHACDYSINNSSNECELTAEYNCQSEAELIDWEYREDANSDWERITPGSPITDNPYIADMDGEYRFVLEHNTCGELFAEEKVVECKNAECTSSVPDITIDLKNISPYISTYTSSATYVSTGGYWLFSDKVIRVTGADELFFIDENVKFDNCTVYFDTGVYVYVSNGSIIASNDTRFTGCNGAYWGGISLLSGQNLNFSDNVTIEDATTSIDIGANSSAHITGTTFLNSAFGLRIKGNFTNLGIRNNTFNSCAIGISIAYSGTTFQYPTNDRGVFITGPSSKASNTISTFDNCNIGIKSNSSVNGLLRFAGCIFTNTVEHAMYVVCDRLEVYHSEMDASISGGTTREGWNQLYMTDCEFHGCPDFGIENLGTAFTYLDNVDFYGVHDPLSGTTSNTTSLSSVTKYQPSIKNCDFFECSGTLIDIDRLSGPFEISDNMVHSFTGERAFDIKEGENVSFKGNEFNLYGNQTAIFAMDGESNSFRDNIVTGSNGIELDGETSPFICSNTLEGNGYGVFFNNANSQNPNQVQFIQNEMTGYPERGLDIQGGAIGSQFHHENCWTNAGAISDDNSRLGSRFDFDDAIGCYLPIPVSHTDWFISGPNPIGSKDCESIDPNSVNSNGNDQVGEDCECQGPYDCYPEPCCTLVDLPECEELVEIYGGNSSMTPGQAWDVYQAITAWWDAFAAAHQWSGPMPTELTDCWDIPPPEGENGGEGESGGSAAVEQSLIQQGRLLSKLEAAQSYDDEETQELGRIIFVMDSLIDALDLTSNSTQQNQIYGQLENIYHELDQFQVDHMQRQESVASEILFNIGSLSEPYDFVYHKNNILQIESELLTKNLEDLSSAQWNDILSAAYSCAYMTGHAAYKARSLYHQVGGPHPISYDDSSICQGVNKRQLQDDSKDGSLVQVYPNPVSGNLNIQIGEEIDLTDQVTIQFFNLLGEEEYSYLLNEDQRVSELNMLSYSEGIHILMIRSEDKLLYTQRIMVIK